MKYAVVTGASSGMGLEFAWQLAERKYGIVIVSNQPEENRRVAEMLRRQNHVDVRVIDMDLTLPKVRLNDWTGLLLCIARHLSN